MPVTFSPQICIDFDYLLLKQSLQELENTRDTQSFSFLCLLQEWPQQCVWMGVIFLVAGTGDVYLETMGVCDFLSYPSPWLIAVVRNSHNSVMVSASTWHPHSWLCVLPFSLPQCLGSTQVGGIFKFGVFFSPHITLECKNVTSFPWRVERGMKGIGWGQPSSVALLGLQSLVLLVDRARTSSCDWDQRCTGQQAGRWTPNSFLQKEAHPAACFP